MRWGELIRCRVGAIGLASAAMALLFMGFAADAPAEVTFCTPGSAAGQCDPPTGIAVDTPSGDVYVADRGNNRIDVFDSAGTFQFAFGWGVDTGAAALEKCTTASSCQKGLAGSGAGELERPSEIAIDDAADFLYVMDNGNNRVQKFDLAGNFLAQFTTTGECVIASGEPVAVGPTGFFYVAHKGSVGKFSQSGECIGVVDLVEPPAFFIRVFAVDPVGNIYASIVRSDTLRKYDPAGAQICASGPDTVARGIGIDDSGHIFVAQGEDATNGLRNFWVVTEYSSACAPQRRFAYGKAQAAVAGLAAYHSPGGEIFIAEEVGMVHYLALPPAGPIVPAISVEAPVAAVSNTKATLRAEINPEGKATQYHFEYLTEKEWEEQGESFSGAATHTTPTGEISPADFKLHGVQALIGCPDPVAEIGSGTCLTPDSRYRFRVVATNADGPGEGIAEGQPFKTRLPGEIKATYATEVGTDTARLSAEANPLGIPTGGYFEYIDDAGYQQSGFAEATKVPDVEQGAGEIGFGAGEAPVLRSLTLFPLAPGTTYHYRLNVSDPLIAPTRLIGPERTFRTFATPLAEQCAANEAFRTGLSALLGDCRAYELVSPLEKGSGDVIPLGEFTTGLPATLDQSSVSGSKLAYGSYRAFGDAESAPFTSQYVAERGPEGWQSHTVTGPRGHLVTEATGTLDTELKALSPDLCDAWLLTVAEPPLAPGAVSGFRNIYRRHDGGGCGEKSYAALTPAPPAHKQPGESLRLELQGLSADGSVSIYTANDNLEGTAAPDNPTGKQQLYQRDVGGATSYVCILPGETPSTAACSAGTNFPQGTGQNRGASVENAISADGQRVFWTAYQGASSGPGQIYVRIGGSETIAVSNEGEVDSGTTSSIFLSAAEDGSKAIFLSGEDLYEFDVETKTTTLIAGEVAGILGAGEDASRIYLVSEEVLSGANGEGGTPSAGKPNLYLAEAGAFSFIATLAAADHSPISLVPFERSSRISADGLHAIFTSFASLTGYENTDAKTGETDAELYRYDAGAEELLCVSCNPTNARPSGGRMVRANVIFRAAVSIPGWENSLYASRALSADGSRVFFESTDVLSPRDTNGVGDVYEWEEPGSGRCSEASPSYSPANGGCLDLISSGHSARSSEFDDASPSGEDVFFSTLASLVSQDYGLVDVYDARAGGGLPSPPPPPLECEGEACQHPAPAPEAQNPSSLGYEGPGNLEEAAAKPPKCPTGKVKRKGRCVKNKHKRQHDKKQRKAAKTGRAPR